MRITALIFGILTLISVSYAFAETVAWTPKTEKIVYSNTRAYYSCDYAKSRAQHYLERLGAKDVSIECSGGLPDFTSLTLDVAFAAPKISDDGVEATWQQVALKTHESCDFNELIVRRLVGHFPTRSMNQQSTCWNAEGSFSYDFETLK